MAKRGINNQISETDDDVQKKIASFVSKNSNYLSAEKLSKAIDKAEKTVKEQRQELYKELSLLTRTLVEKFDKKHVQKFLREKFHKTYGNSDIDELNRVGRMLETHGEDNFDSFTIQNLQITSDQNDEKICEIIKAENDIVVFDDRASTGSAKEFKSAYGIKKEDTTSETNADDIKEDGTQTSTESNDIEDKLKQTLILLADVEELVSNEEELPDAIYRLASQILANAQSLNQRLESIGKTEAHHEQSESAYSSSH